MTLLSLADAIAANNAAGAAELLEVLLPLLADALHAGEAETREVVRRVCRGQPGMAALWNACAAAAVEPRQPGRFARVRAEMERAPAALVRVGATMLLEDVGDRPRPLIVTMSYSSSVMKVLAAVHERHPLRIVCGEGRPRFEGRTLATRLGSVGAEVTLTTDAALTTYLAEASAVVCGADALAAGWWINKVGTLGVCAAAARVGVPVSVLATRDKAMARVLAGQWSGKAGPAEEVWSAPTDGVVIGNPYFERIPADLANRFVTDIGVLAASDLPALAERYASDLETLLSLIS